MLLFINKKQRPPRTKYSAAKYMSRHLICLILSFYIHMEIDSTVKHSDGNTKRVVVFVWIILFFHCNRLVGMPPLAPGGKTMYEHRAEMRCYPQESLQCLAGQSHVIGSEGWQH